MWCSFVSMYMWLSNLDFCRLIRLGLELGLHSRNEILAKSVTLVFITTTIINFLSCDPARHHLTTKRLSLDGNLPIWSIPYWTTCLPGSSRSQSKLTGHQHASLPLIATRDDLSPPLITNLALASAKEKIKAFKRLLEVFANSKAAVMSESRS